MAPHSSTLDAEHREEKVRNEDQQIHKPEY